jgi:hypothetical protein
LTLQVMAYGSIVPDELSPDALSPDEIADCFKPLEFGVDQNPNGKPSIFEDEAKEIAARRSASGIPGNPRMDAIGLALSGGGIRSATFCLGVIQVLADRGLMKDFDGKALSGIRLTGGFSGVLGI